MDKKQLFQICSRPAGGHIAGRPHLWCVPGDSLESTVEGRCAKEPAGLGYLFLGGFGVAVDVLAGIVNPHDIKHFRESQAVGFVHHFGDIRLVGVQFIGHVGKAQARLQKQLLPANKTKQTALMQKKPLLQKKRKSTTNL